MVRVMSVVPQSNWPPESSSSSVLPVTDLGDGRAPRGEGGGGRSVLRIVVSRQPAAAPSALNVQHLRRHLPRFAAELTNPLPSNPHRSLRRPLLGAVAGRASLRFYCAAKPAPTLPMHEGKI